MKRTFDIVISIIALPVAVLVIVIFYWIIRATSPGPAIFRQRRVGRNEAQFTCFKLRTMFLETKDVPTHEAAKSSVTPIGKYLRKLKIDELPQLLNIIRGEMSFVGPRPCLPTQHKLIAARRTLGVYALRPGITGVAQVAGVDMTDPERLAKLDAAYLKDQSIWKDLTLIIRTVFGAGQGDKVVE